MWYACRAAHTIFYSRSAVTNSDGQLLLLTCLLPTPVSDCPVALALCSPSCSVPLSRGANALNRFICVTWRNLINCYLSLFPSLVIFCWRCKPPLTGGGMRDMHSRSVLHLGFVTLATGLATSFVNVRASVSRVFRQPSGVANLRLGDRIRGVENTNPLWCPRTVAYSRGRSAVPSPAWSAFFVLRPLVFGLEVFKYLFL